jgi:nitroimidazol reductase NimA-like FMN-containing flavoprotein (pyridoxamine 5'-phosphate oxidase superfamily)
MTDTLSPTARTAVVRGRKRARTDRDELHRLLEDALIAHLGVDAGGHPLVLPVAFAVDLDGADDGGTLYIHGSVAARWLTTAASRTVCVTITELDGLVAARSGFHHSMNYRSAVVIGDARIVTDPDERTHALALTVDHMIPGRSATLRAPSRKELAATAVLAVPLREASMKARDGGPVDEPDDVAAGAWAGVIPMHRAAGAPVSATDSHDRVPVDVRRRAAGLAAPAHARVSRTPNRVQ